MTEYSTIELTLLRTLREGIAPRELMQAVRASHPEATKKEIIHAAFLAMIALAEHDANSARELQNFALKARGNE